MGIEGRRSDGEQGSGVLEMDLESGERRVKESFEVGRDVVASRGKVSRVYRPSRKDRRSVALDDRSRT